jgi:hypothetical protein
MQTWSLTDLPLGDSAYGVAGYAVLDALGVRMGYVSGWVKDPDGRVRMLKIAIREMYETNEYLVPIGSVTLIDDARNQIQLRELTRRLLPKYCMRFDDELPEPQLLRSLIRFFPNPRPSVVERLQRPEEVPLRPNSRLTIYDDQGDGSKRFSLPTFEHEPDWLQLGNLGPPSWRPLVRLSEDAKWHY